MTISKAEAFFNAGKIKRLKQVGGVHAEKMSNYDSELRKRMYPFQANKYGSEVQDTTKEVIKEFKKVLRQQEFANPHIPQVISLNSMWKDVEALIDHLFLMNTGNAKNNHITAEIVMDEFVHSAEVSVESKSKTELILEALPREKSEAVSVNFLAEQLDFKSSVIAGLLGKKLGTNVKKVKKGNSNSWWFNDSKG